MSDEPNGTQSDDEDDGLKSFEELSSDAELDEAKLQQELAKYRKAFAEEFEVSLKSEEAAKDPTKAHEYLKHFFKQNLPMAAAQIAWLSQNAQAESVKLAASKYVVEHALEDSKKDGDPVAAILAALNANDTQPQPDHEA